MLRERRTDRSFRRASQTGRLSVGPDIEGAVPAAIIGSRPTIGCWPWPADSSCRFSFHPIALAEAGRSLRDIEALDVVSVGLRGDNMDERGALCRISFLVDNGDG